MKTKRDNKWIKPDYCTDRKQDCFKCELFKNDECSLKEEHLLILKTINDREKQIKEDKS